MVAPNAKEDWQPEHAVLPYADIGDESVTIHNLRSRTFRPGQEIAVSYRDKSVLLPDVVSADLGLATLPGYGGVAHTFASFALRDGSRIAISIEARRHRGERFSPIRGLFNTYQLMYVIADESDVVGGRAVVNKVNVLLYPLRLSSEQLQAMFVSMLMRANAIKENPEFYNTVMNSCTTNLVRHVDLASPGSIRASIRIPLSLSVDRLAYESGLIDTSAPFDEARKRGSVSERARAVKEGADFSAAIRRF